MPDEKAKRKQPPSKWFWLRRLTACIITLLIAILCVLAVLGELPYDGYLKTRLPDELRPTAEYLETNPQPTPVNNPLSVSIRNGAVEIFLPDNPDHPYPEIRTYTELYLNGGKVLVRDVGRAMRIASPNIYQFSINVVLPEGLHLIEIRAKTDLFSEPLFVHTWAVRIEN